MIQDCHDAIKPCKQSFACLADLRIICWLEVVRVLCTFDMIDECIDSVHLAQDVIEPAALFGAGCGDSIMI